MTAEAPTKPAAPPKETWLDRMRAWKPDGAPDPDPEGFLTREELLEEVNRNGNAVNPRTLAFWEREGVLPRPVRRWVGGRPHALYPELAIPAINHVRELQGQGLNLRAISRFVESWIAIEYVHLFPDPEKQRQARERWLPSPEDVEPPITALARRHERVRPGPPIVKAELRFTDASGVEFVVHSFSVEPPPD